MPDLLEKVKETITEYGMIPTGVSRVLVAVSGGPDSVVLADLLMRLSEEVRLFLCLAHLDHMFRGEESAEDAGFVQTWAEERHLPCIVEARDVSSLIRPGESKQEAARRVRYEFLQEAAEEFGAQRIALAHTMSDQAETVLMRLITGGGTPGLSGIPPVREERFIRPLIKASREDIEAYAHWRGLSYRIDPSNETPVYLRNKIRLQLVPYIKSEFNPKIEKTLARTAEIIRAEGELLQEITLEWLRKQGKRKNNIPTISLESLVSEPRALQRRIIRELYSQTTGASLSFDHIEKVLELAHKDGNLELDLPGASVRKSYTELQLIADTTSSQPLAGKTWRLPIPGKLADPALPAIFSTEVFQGGWNYWQKASTDPEYDPRRLALFDLNSLELPLSVRTRKPGDLFQPFGLRGTKKLKDFFIDEKVPLARRDNIPLVFDQKGIIWVCGLRQSERGRITAETSQILQIKLEKLPAEYPYDIIS